MGNFWKAKLLAHLMYGYADEHNMIQQRMRRHKMPQQSDPASNVTKELKVSSGLLFGFAKTQQGEFVPGNNIGKSLYFSVLARTPARRQAYALGTPEKIWRAMANKLYIQHETCHN